MRLVFSNLWKQLEKLCTLDSDSYEVRREKVTLVVITGLCTLASIIWGAIYYALLGATTTTYIRGYHNDLHYFWIYRYCWDGSLYFSHNETFFSPSLCFFLYDILEPDCDAMEFGRICRFWSFDAVVPFSSI